MAAPLSLRTDRRDDGTAVLTAAGEVDLSNIDTFAEAIATAKASTSADRPLSVDLSEVDYLDSGAINVLFDHADHIHLVVNPVLMSVLTISGLTGVTRVEPAPRR